jgi:hypothetical protein
MPVATTAESNKVPNPLSSGRRIEQSITVCCQVQRVLAPVVLSDGVSMTPITA